MSAPYGWPRFELTHTSTFHERVRHYQSEYTIGDVARFRPSPELEQQLRHDVAELSASYSRALDAAAMLLLAHGCRDIARVMQPSGRDELWIDAPADRTRVGEVLPGRCVYRQWMRADGKMSIVREWLDPVLAEVAERAVQS